MGRNGGRSSWDGRIRTVARRFLFCCHYDDGCNHERRSADEDDRAVHLSCERREDRLRTVPHVTQTPTTLCAINSACSGRCLVASPFFFLFLRARLQGHRSSYNWLKRLRWAGTAGINLPATGSMSPLSAKWPMRWWPP